MFGLSGTHLLIILIVVLIIFGPGKLPQLGKQLGNAINEFRNTMKPKDESDKPPDDTTKNA